MNPAASRPRTILVLNPAMRKPNQIHIIGLYPVIRSKAFDMASNGLDFKLYIPSRNLFLTGSNEPGKP